MRRQNRLELIELLVLMSQGVKSTRGLAKILGCHYNTVHKKLKKLEKAGLVYMPSKRRFELTEEGKAMVEKEHIKTWVNIRDFIEKIQTLIELRVKEKDENRLEIIKVDGLRFVLLGTFIHLMAIVEKLSEKITKENMEEVMDSAYASILKELLASVSTFCIGLGKEGWKEFHRIGRDLTVYVIGSSLNLDRLLDS